MSTDDEDRLLGRYIRELAEHRSRLKQLHRDRCIMARCLTRAVDELKASGEPASPDEMTKLPDQAERFALMTQTQNSEDSIEDLQEAIRELGYEPPSEIGEATA